MRPSLDLFLREGRLNHHKGLNNLVTADHKDN
jgi:hypothetical protein